MNDQDKNVLLAEFMEDAVYGVLETGGNPLKAIFAHDDLARGIKKGYNLQFGYHSFDKLMEVYLKVKELIIPPGTAITQTRSIERYEDLSKMQTAILTGDPKKAFHRISDMVDKYWKR